MPESTQNILKMRLRSEGLFDGGSPPDGPLYLLDDGGLSCYSYILKVATNAQVDMARRNITRRSTLIYQSSEEAARLGGRWDTVTAQCSPVITSGPSNLVPTKQ